MTWSSRMSHIWPWSKISFRYRCKRVHVVILETENPFSILFVSTFCYKVMLNYLHDKKIRHKWYCIELDVSRNQYSQPLTRLIWLGHILKIIEEQNNLISFTSFYYEISSLISFHHMTIWINYLQQYQKACNMYYGWTAQLMWTCT